MQPELPGIAHDGSGAVDMVPPEERVCNDVAERMMQMGRELEAQKKIVADLMRHVGTKNICTGPRCHQEIFFVFHVDSKRLTPYNADGTNHYITCIDRDLFHRRKKNA